MTIGNKEVFAKNLKNFVDKSGRDRKEIAKTLGVPYSSLPDWMNGNKYPRIHNLEKLADYFKVSKSDLIEDFEAKKKDNAVLSTIIVKLRMDSDLLEITDRIVSLDKAQVDSLRRLLDTFV